MLNKSLRYMLAYSAGPSSLQRAYHDTCTPPALSEKFRQVMEAQVIPWHQKVVLRERMLQQEIDEEGCSAVFAALKLDIWTLSGYTEPARVVER